MSRRRRSFLNAETYSLKLSRSQLKTQLWLGVIGELFIFIILKLAAPCLYSWAGMWANWICSLSLGLVPLLILLESKAHIQLVLPGKLGRQVLTGFVLGCVMGISLNFIGPKTGYSSGGEAAYRLVYYLIAVGLTEEFVYRGFFYERLKEICLSDWAPALVSSGLFALGHLFVGKFGIGQFVIGLFFCWCREKLPHCSLLSLIIAHGLHDWLIRFL